MRRLITIGSQHQGVMTIPGCIDYEQNTLFYRKDPSGYTLNSPSTLCYTWRRLLSRGVYAPLVRYGIVQAQYYKNWRQLKQYHRYNKFLTDINLETDSDNQLSYRKNVESLERLVLVMFDPDTVVIPRQSSWFGWKDESGIVPLQEQPIYEKLGLKCLDERKALFFIRKKGGHMAFDETWFKRLVAEHLQ